MTDLGKILVLTGMVLAVLGAVLWLGDKVPWLGRLPGDIRIERGNFRFYLPLTTCVLVSVVVTLIVWVLRKR
ncbi:DUF2905 domain-containing protein [bacterium]|nr:DUF2905 domain-containing protein [bacterium]